NVLGFTQ
nr:Chain O, A peptide substrate-NVLGFTQ [synthetic construct]2ZL2_P Chain P, A peptide substrate-NVLGFTQ [synthetic construct]2ZL2_Q Chain Q, A peptide substrate-NVLGFTQ [synthetic construct]2ZL2_T Chain T, A peptide substrate-NVLGFTQ [synthetic construct]2ZL2_U Chain U, A peptide substrate-NVLGFTQ [synthetic construct]2ZL2_V Chain V, A peptide substrate-NVLGFTQ [synthetic construct]2ZL2_W Chain W, A peptide substrate-NVLGFTQ [synthetic construct]2ZL2_X Chain X, A peptide substrate-NVLGFTQ [